MKKNPSFTYKVNDGMGGNETKLPKFDEKWQVLQLSPRPLCRGPRMHFTHFSGSISGLILQALTVCNTKCFQFGSS